MIKPKKNSNKGVVIGFGINYKYGKFDPYNMALANIHESIRIYYLKNIRDFFYI